MSDSEQRRFDRPPGEGLAESSSLCPDPLLQALHDVPVPAGLERRLLKSLARSGSQSDPLAIDVNDALAGDTDPKAFPTSWARKARLGSRRMWLSGTLAAGCGGMLLGSYGWLRRPLLEHMVIDQALRWPPWLNQRGEDGWDETRYVNGSPLPVDGFPIPMALQAHRSQYLKTEFSSRTVVYDVNFRGETVYLFAIKTWRDLSALPAAPPALPPTNQTGAWIVVTWQASGCLYVLALPKSAVRLYRQLLRVSPSGLV